VTTSDLSLRSTPRLAARSFAIDGPVDLLDHYSPDGFAWLDRDHGFVTSGIAARVAPEDALSFLASIHHTTDRDTTDRDTTNRDTTDRDGAVSDAAGPRAAGALPFTGSGDLVVPALIVGRDARGAAWRTVIEPVDAGEHESAVSGAAYPPAFRTRFDAAPSEFQVSGTTTLGQWRAMVERAIADIDRGQLEKVVLARAVRIDADRPFDLPSVLAHLRRSQPGCVVYADRGFIGASPELLVRKAGAAVTSRPLAGTSVDTAALVRSKKDAHEHRLVVDAVVGALRSLCSDVRAQGTSALELADISHLATTITARADASGTSVADLVALLHPTPAVAGTPRRAAIDMIAAHEPVGRGRYAGPCGWIDRNGDGEFVVALRGGEIDGRHAVIHAGAGIVRGSDPDAEWVETQQKLTPMLQALVRP
jgi:menaquinone-specific isochorismate synthase